MNEQEKPLILNVDDYEATLYAKSHVLRRAGFEVIEARGGQETLRLVDERNPQLVLLDVNLPDINGIEVCRRIKAREGSSKTLVLQISASFLSTADKTRALEGGADSYLTEPVEPEELIATVRSLLRLQRVEADLLNKNERLELLAQAAEHLLSTDDPQQAVRGLFEKIAGRFGLSVYFNFMVDEESGKLKLDTCAGISEEDQAKIRNIEFGQSVCGNVALRKSRIIASFVQQSSDPMTELIRGYGIRAYVCHPLMIGQRLLGTLSFGTRSKDRFTDDEVELFRTLCYYVAMAMERARLTEIERQRGAQLTLIANENQRLYQQEQSARLEAESARSVAEEANRLKDEFLATVSHELRAPLNAIRGWASLLRQGKLSSEETAKAIETIENNTLSQNRLIEDLLDVSRIITGKLQLDVQQIQLADVIQSVIESLGPAAKARGILLLSELDPTAGLVSADLNRLQQIVWNLLSNAVKFTSRGGWVRTRLERRDSHVEVSVTDSGTGISPDFLPYVFDRFRQADGSTRRKYSGLGLGLAIVRHLVELHGGRVSAYSEGEGKGATFTILLPLVAVSSPLKEPPAPGVNLVPDRDFNIRLDGLRVLLVDDEKDAREMLSILLENYGAEPLTASSCAEGLEILEREQVDVIISDIGMPGEDGFQFIQRVREHEAGRISRLPAVALTGFARAEDRMRILAAGFHTHIAKPIDPNEFVVVLAGLTGRIKFGESFDTAL